MATDLSSLKWATVPQADFSTLGNLQKTFLAARREGNRDRALADIDPNNPQSLATLGMKLVQAGDTTGGLAAAQLARQNTNDDWQRQYQGGMLKVAQQNAGRQETPQQLQVLRAAGIDPASPEGRKALFPKTDTPISATDKKAIFEAEDANVPLQSTLDTLKRTKELAPKAFSGYTAGIRGTVGANLPSIAGAVGIDPKGAEATVELNQLLSGEAIKNMAETLKGATTDSEMNRFTTILADPNSPPQLKMRTIERMETLAARKAEINNARIKDLRGGTYFQPQGGQPAQRPAQGAPVRVNSPQERDALPPGSQYIAPDGSLRTKQ